MLNIVENPKTKKLYAAGECQHENGKVGCYAFDGTPVSLDITGWAIVGQAPTVKDWFNEPGRYNTYYAAISVFMIEPSGKKFSFKMGDNISYLLNWIADASINATISYQWIGAFSDRNKARKYNA